ncbi:MAG: redox-regulated ATPase YchF [Treponema sp.]|jgi:GTP-binding protein YchF|nr:redox-regulated ATPase YchF [Treponema sp.]
MALNCGIVGLPNVGKSTIFRALSGAEAEAANYPFCTINPNIGICSVPDSRLDRLTAIFSPRRTIPATVEFVDIAGLVRGASQGEGLGNQFLAHIREVGVIANIVRCFNDSTIVHVEKHVDPLRDMDIIAIELALADLDTALKRKDKAEKALKSRQKNAALTIQTLDKIIPVLEEGKGVRTVPLSSEEKESIIDCHFISIKPQLYVCNVDEQGMREGNAYIKAVQERAEQEQTEAVTICGKFEAELADITEPSEKSAFLAEIGLAEPSLHALIHAVYRLLGLRTFFTVGADECRAWTIRAGASAPQAAGVIHSDFEKGFIKAETYGCADIFKYGSEALIKDAGKYRIEGREYIVQDGDVLFFKFNV